ncbi:hypothetical protein PQR34_21775 [Paraburkholderia sediminicola]|uniref:hypothetical protein n=1 Tax=Paraburkholderia sediminicola TaxID=458836 RepID=UPI0038BCDF29
MGKTTLILDMLGIADEHLPAVSRVLRGGRSVGKSSTATALRYRKSDDEFWRIGDAALGLSDDDVESFFGRVRADVEAGRREIPDVLDVYVPRQFFSDQADALKLDIRLLDLPGLNAANQNEVEYVRRVAQQYVPFADLIVLVGRADDLGFINPVALQLPELQDWAIYPRRFRIVCTYSFSSASFREWFGEGHRSADEVKARLMKQLKTHDYPLPAELQQFIYPLEFGASWNDLKRAREDYFERAQQVVKELRADFIEGIRKAANRYSRMQMVFDLQKIADGKISAFRQRNDSAIDQLGEAIREYNDQLCIYEAARRSAKERADKLADIDAHLTDHLTGNSLDAVLKRAFGGFESVPSRPSERTASELVAEAQRCYCELQKLWSNFPYGQQEPVAAVEPARQDHADEESEVADQWPSLGNAPSLRGVTDYIDRLNGYWIGYIPGLSGFEKDFALLAKTMELARGSYINAARKSVVGQWESERAEARKEAARLARNQAVLDFQCDSLRASLDEKQVELEGVRLAGEAFQQRMKHSIEHGNRFRSHMKQAHLDGLSAVERRFRNETNPARQFYLLAFRHLIEPEYEKMMNGVSD